MPLFELAELTAPVSEEDPCGPDLDLAGDAEFMNFIARSEGVLPAKFFDSEGKPFDRSTIDFDAEYAAVKSLMAKTRDLRLLTILAKLFILNRDFESFETSVAAMAALLREHWEAVNPRGEEGDFSLRGAAASTLDDMPVVILPLQFLPLVEHRRFGTITYRSQMMAAGEVQPREGEAAVDANAIDQAMMDADLPALIALRDRFLALQEALTEIQRISVEKAGYEQAVSLDRLPPLVDKISAFLDAAVSKRDPSATRLGEKPGEAADAGAEAAGAETTAAIPAGSVNSTAAAAAALAAIADYFSRREPSNPALLLVRQAEQLIGKSFLDVMRILMPAHIEQTIIEIGDKGSIQLPLERLSEFADTAEAWSAPPEPTETAEWGGEDGETPATDGSDGGTEPAGADPLPMEGGIPRFRLRSRREAVALLDQVGTYFRVAEPSNPIPIMTDRARNLADRDFLSLLRDFLPESALKSRTDEG